MPKDRAGTSPSKFLENNGILFSYQFDESGSIASDEAEAAWHWKILALTDARARREIDHQKDIPEAARQAMLLTDELDKLSFGEGWLYGSIPDMLHEHYGEAGKLGHLRLALCGKVLLIGRRQPLQTLDDIRLAVEEGKLRLAEPFDFVKHMVPRLMDGFSQRIAAISSQLDVIEDRIVGDSWQGERERLSNVRRLAVALNRQIATISGVFRAVEQAQRRELPAVMSEWFGEFVHRGVAQHHDVEQLQARARLLQEEVMARLSERSNSLLSIISVMTAVMLPATIVTGMFGMNTDGLPFTGNPYGFWLATGAAALLASVFYLLIKRLLNRL